VWDYPRPPLAVASTERVRVVHRGSVLADTTSAIRVLEESHAPTYYLPRADVDMDAFIPRGRRTVCEWKGVATHFAIEVAGHVVEDAAWTYEIPTARYRSIANHIAIYAQRVDECWVDDERVRAVEGDFYGGWITSRVVGPFKGGPNTSMW
jgi:uncharacterized protein (DUF427 family)